MMMVAFKFDIWETPADKITFSVSTIGCVSASCPNITDINCNKYIFIHLPITIVNEGDRNV